MKKIYSQPIVETTKVQAMLLMEGASPIVVRPGGSTSGIPVPGDTSIPGE